MQKLFLLSLLFSFISCSSEKEDPQIISGEYTGSGSVTQGLAATNTEDLLASCHGRKAGLGTITSTDSKIWTVPAVVNYTETSFPFASDLHNNCSGNTYSSVAQAEAALISSNVITIDEFGDLVTAYIFADNYFEIYINGIPVGKDPVPFTEFNSSIVQFKVTKPYTIAVKLVDWEENLGLGSENNGGKAYHPGDGGFVALFKNESGAIDAITNSNWKAQTYYISPVKDLACLTEAGNKRLSASCNDEGVNDGSEFYGIHWEIPSDWNSTTFDDSTWPAAVEYADNTVGVDNKSSYTNFTSVFDLNGNDAKFIWSSNLILDNVVLTRFTVN